MSDLEVASVEAGKANRPSGTYRPGYEVAAERIVELIVRQRLAPGDRLPTEAELAKILGTSRSIVREAVKILSALGRVRVHKARGIFVADDPGLLGSVSGSYVPADLDHVLWLFEFRRVQEMASCRYAAERATPAEVQAIGAAAHRSRGAADSEDLDAFDASDDDFHSAVAQATHNPFLTSVIATLRSLQYQSAILGLRHTATRATLDAGATQHLAIYEAIRTGQPDQAAQAAAEHIESTMRSYHQEIQRRLFDSPELDLIYSHPEPLTREDQ